MFENLGGYDIINLELTTAMERDMNIIKARLRETHFINVVREKA